MNRKNIIGIPIKNLEEPMSRLASTLDKNQRIDLQIGLIKNLAECFRGKDNDIFLISNDSEIFTVRSYTLWFKPGVFLRLQHARRALAPI